MIIVVMIMADEMPKIKSLFLQEPIKKSRSNEKGIVKRQEAFYLS
jgi:hypothetical protein